MRILVDIDGVITDTLGEWLKAIEQRYGILANPEDITQWELHKCPPLNELHSSLIYGILDTPGFYYNLPFLDSDCPKVLEALNKEHEVFLVTARENAERETRLWMKHKLPFLQSHQLVFTSKKEIIKADLIIDDKAETLEAYTKAHPESEYRTIPYQYNRKFWHKDRQPGRFRSEWESIGYWLATEWKR